jgi:biopolymer transport protein ExbD
VSDWVTRCLRNCIDEFTARLQAEAAKEPQPDLHIRGDKEVRYERVAQAMAAAQRAGVRKIGFVTEPTP